MCRCTAAIPSRSPNSSIATQIGSLPPEQGKSWEVGGKLALPNGITGTLALFDITKRNVMVNELVEGNRDAHRRARAFAGRGAGRSR